MFSFLYHCQYFCHITFRLYIWVTRRRGLIRSRSYLHFMSIWVHPHFFGDVRFAHFISFMCCPISTMRLYVLSSMLWCPLRVPHTNDVRFVFTPSCLYEGLCLIHFANQGLRTALLIFPLGNVRRIFVKKKRINKWIKRRLTLSIHIRKLME